MKESKLKNQKYILSNLFKEKCKETIKQQPRNYLVNALKDNTISIDMEIFIEEDLPCFQILLSLPLNKISFFVQDPALQKSSPSKTKSSNNLQKSKCFFETPKFKQLILILAKAIESSLTLRSVKFQRIPISTKFLKCFNECLKNTKRLKEFGLINSQMTDEHLEAIKSSLAQNQSLITLDLSFNNLCDIGGMIGKILSEHSRRRTQIVWVYNLRGQAPQQDISNMGLCEVNLEGNQLNDRSVSDLITFLKDDSWTKCINLKKNNIKMEGVKQFALLLKTNASLISLDLRQNEGLTKEYSRYIYKKLVLNMQKYKEIKQRYSKRKYQSNNTNPKIQPKQQKQPIKTNTIKDIFKTQKPMKKNENNQKLENENYKSTKIHSNYETYDKNKEYTTIVSNNNMQAEHNSFNNRINFTIDDRIRNKNQQKPLEAPEQINPYECSQCKQKTFKMLKLQKKNLDLQFQMKRLKNVLLTKNIDISTIIPSNQNQIVSQNQHNSLIEWLSNRSNQNDDELLQRMQQIMMQLTKIIETIEDQQNTKGNISNPLENANSLSNTIQLYAQNSRLEELQRSINERMSEDKIQSSGNDQNILEPTTSIEKKLTSLV